MKSGFLIAGKLVAAFCIAAAFLPGCAVVHEAASSSEIVIGWLLITLSIVVMAFTVRFWAAGFVGFIAYAALRLLGGALFASSLRVSPLHMLSVAASLFAMNNLCIRFASGKPRFTQIHRASLVLAATCALLTLPLMDSHRSVVVLNVGNVALVLWWLAARASRQARQSAHNTVTNEWLTKTGLTPTVSDPHLTGSYAEGGRPRSMGAGSWFSISCSDLIAGAPHKIEISNASVFFRLIGQLLNNVHRRVSNARVFSVESTQEPRETVQPL